MKEERPLFMSQRKAEFPSNMSHRKAKFLGGEALLHSGQIVEAFVYRSGV